MPLMGKIISMVIFHSKLLNYQRVAWGVGFHRHFEMFWCRSTSMLAGEASGPLLRAAKSWRATLVESCRPKNGRRNQERTTEHARPEVSWGMPPDITGDSFPFRWNSCGCFQPQGHAYWFRWLPCSTAKKMGKIVDYVSNGFKFTKEYLVGGLEHVFYLSIQLGSSSSQLTKWYFSEG